ncbi:hypothetical protein MKX68_24845 [Paenibacillus sp. FSL M8-0212]|uniref:hypothetical protein n=1 Tax=Paenibacillus sp. FSL M8-0212 TaxID=2921618 RepID=UPI0030F7ACFB
MGNLPRLDDDEAVASVAKDGAAIGWGLKHFLVVLSMMGLIILEDSGNGWLGREFRTINY